MIREHLQCNRASQILVGLIVNVVQSTITHLVPVFRDMSVFRLTVIQNALSILIAHHTRLVLLKNVETPARALADLGQNVAYTTTFLFAAVRLDIREIHSYNAPK